MDASQQHLLDLYRAAQHRAPAPPAPGTGERQAIREFRTWRQFLAVVDERAARRQAAFRRFLPWPRPASPVPGHPLQQRADRLADGRGRPVQC
ncbi:hypothetical protein ACIHFE_29470 [Streptomyces sp. NPDC052396]|uniref:hypothetical protein n=1 Tax=Streptomyces sp. NPDC052396 TaxID=3365689 RepID=UPI0037D531A4